MHSVTHARRKLTIVLAVRAVPQQTNYTPSQPGRFQIVVTGGCEDVGKGAYRIFRIHTETGATYLRQDAHSSMTQADGQKHLFCYDYWERVDEGLKRYDWGKEGAEIRSAAQ